MTPPETTAPPSEFDLPAGWTASPATLDDVDDLVRLLRSKERAARGSASADGTVVEAELTGRGARPREHIVLRQGGNGASDVGPLGGPRVAPPARAWASVHDRAAGRTVVAVTVDPGLDDALADRLAATLFTWAVEQGTQIARGRGRIATQLDSGSFAEDPRQHRWLTAAGYSLARTWWQMSRPVTPEEGSPGCFAEPKAGVVARRIRLGRDGLPDPRDLRSVHDVLESSFADHFNSYEETFEEFISRQRESPGHRWDHWWLGEVSTASGAEPAGAVVCSVVPGGLDPDGEPQAAGSYIDYIGVLASARGRGVATSMLRAVIADAALRGRNRVGLEVDADSPTGADGLYAALGWRTSYVTQSWHRDIDVPELTLCSASEHDGQ